MTNPTQRLINFGLLVSPLVCYLEWADKSAFLFEVEYALIFKAGQTAQSFAHPLILIPLSGQLLLIVAIIRNPQNMRLTFIGMSFLSLIVLAVALIGILSANMKIIISALPFMTLSILAVVYYRKMKQSA